GAWVISGDCEAARLCSRFFLQDSHSPEAWLPPHEHLRCSTPPCNDGLYDDGVWPTDFAGACTCLLIACSTPEAWLFAPRNLPVPVPSNGMQLQRSLCP